MKITILGGGAWGVTLAQVLVDNNHQVLIYEPNLAHVHKINHHYHPHFNLIIPSQIKATDNLMQALNFSSLLLLVIPSCFIKALLTKIITLTTKPLAIISASKGIEEGSLALISEVVKKVVPAKQLVNFATITGPSHAEEVILRKLTLLTVASENALFAKKIQHLFANNNYLRVYYTTDLIGAEVGGAAKNAIAVMAGFATGLQLGENARAALITRGLNEIKRLTLAYGGKIETTYGLTGLGDLVVTCSSEHSRNFQAGKKLAEGFSVSEITKHSTQTIEGFRSIISFYEYGQRHGLYLPLIESAALLLTKQYQKDEVVSILLEKSLKEE